MAVKGARCAALTRGIYICRAVPSGCGSLQASWGNRETPKARVPRFPAPLPAPSPGPRAHCVHHGRLGYRAVAGHRRKPPSPADTTHPTRAGGRGNSPPRGKDAPCETLPSLEPGAQVSPDLPALTRPANVRHCPPTAAAPGCTAAALARALNARGITGIITAAAPGCAVISVTADLTVWTDSRQLWCTYHGQRRTWPAADSETAAAQLAALARPAPDL